LVVAFGPSRASVWRRRTAKLAVSDELELVQPGHTAAYSATFGWPLPQTLADHLRCPLELEKMSFHSDSPPLLRSVSRPQSATFGWPLPQTLASLGLAASSARVRWLLAR